jgi:hypothetical protein
VCDSVAVRDITVVCDSPRDNVRLSISAAVRVSARSSVWLCARKRAAVQPCAAVRQCAAVCGSAAVRRYHTASHQSARRRRQDAVQSVLASYNTVFYQSARRSKRAGDSCCAIVASIK